jgi:hypothetical protein
VELAQLLGALGEAAQDLFAEAMGREPAVVIADGEELQRARQLAECVGVAAKIDGVVRGTQVALGRGRVVTGQFEVARDQVVGEVKALLQKQARAR